GAPSRSDRHGRPGELAPQPHEQSLECELRVELELLEAAPGVEDSLDRALCAEQALARPVGSQIIEPVVVDNCPLGTGRDDDEVAVPGRELFEGGEELLALGPTLSAPHPQLRLACG